MAVYIYIYRPRCWTQLPQGVLGQRPQHVICPRTVHRRNAGVKAVFRRGWFLMQTVRINVAIRAVIAFPWSSRDSRSARRSVRRSPRLSGSVGRAIRRAVGRSVGRPARCVVGSSGGSSDRRVVGSFAGRARCVGRSGGRPGRRWVEWLVESVAKLRAVARRTGGEVRTSEEMGGHQHLPL